MEQAMQQEKKSMQTNPNIAQPQTDHLGQPKKKSMWWLWIILVLIVLGAAVGIYYWLF